MLITVGIWIFADRIGWVHVSLWQLLVPGLLLFVGGTLVWRALQGRRPRSRDAGRETIEDHAEFVRSFALMSGCELRPVSRPFRGADLNAVMGGIKLDLTDARMEGDTRHGRSIRVLGRHRDLRAARLDRHQQVTTLMGGFIDKRRPTSVLPTKTLIVRGMVVMSGIEVKN